MLAQEVKITIWIIFLNFYFKNWGANWWRNFGIGWNGNPWTCWKWWGGLIEINKKKKNKKDTRGQHIHDTTNCGDNNILNSDKEYEQKFTGYPKNILEFDRDTPQIHPTQKPVLLLEYLIKTYSLENNIILDNAMGSGSTGVACINTNRKFLGIEIDDKIFNIAKERIENLWSKSVFN